MIHFRTLLFGLALVSLPVVALAEGMSLADIARLNEITAAEISPDGRHVAILRSVPRSLPEQADGPAWTELHLVGPDGVPRPFVTGEVNVGQIGWQPQGRLVTFLQKRAGDDTTRLYGIPVDGGEARLLAGLQTDISGYSLSPDGRRVALLAFEPEEDDLKKARDRGFSQVVYEEDWRPRRVWIQELEASQATPRMLELEGSAQGVDWSPAGDRLAVRLTPRELIDDTLMFQRIHIVSPEGVVLGRVDTPGKLGAHAWNRDGSRLALIATDFIHDTREGRLMVVGADGGVPVNLLPALEGHVWNVDWLGAHTIVFVSHEGTRTRIGTIRSDGTNALTRLDDGTVWTSISVAEDGDLALVGHAQQHPAEAFRLNRRSRDAVRLSDSNPWLADRRLVRQETIRYPARDGLEIEGILFYPMDYAEDQRYPLILAVHGGPEAHYSDGWLTSYNLPAQHAAAQGYFMFYPNYRGSTGRGVEFALSSQGRPAMEEFDDLVDGVDHLIERGMVDPERVGITGGSYGGYASAWGVTYYSDRFAAAVMNVGLTDKVAAIGTSDIPQEFHLVHYRVWPWQNWALFHQASPLYHVTKAKTPILILHGDADPRVDPTQSRMLFRYLSLQENPPPARLVLYPGEGHGNRRAASRWDYSLRLMRWMDHYLKGEGGAPPDYRVEYGFD